MCKALDSITLHARKTFEKYDLSWQARQYVLAMLQNAEIGGAVYDQSPKSSAAIRTPPKEDE